MLCSSSDCHIENERVNQLTAFYFHKKQHRAFRKNDKIHEVLCFFFGSCLHFICRATNAKHIVNWSLFLLKTIKKTGNRLLSRTQSIPLLTSIIIKTSPCTVIFNDLLCFSIIINSKVFEPFCLLFMPYKFFLHKKEQFFVLSANICLYCLIQQFHDWLNYNDLALKDYITLSMCVCMCVI